jgi:hypothetical protein
MDGEDCHRLPIHSARSPKPLHFDPVQRGRRQWFIPSCRTYGVARPAQRLDSTAFSMRWGRSSRVGPVAWPTSRAHLSIASWMGEEQVDGRLRLVQFRRGSSGDQSAGRGLAGATGCCRVSRYQMASVSLRATSTRATLGPHWRPSRCLCADSGRGSRDGGRRGWPLRSAPNAGTAGRSWPSGRAGRGRRTGRSGAPAGVAAELLG